MKQLLRMFNAVEVNSKRKGIMYKKWLAKTLPHGFILDPMIIGNKTVFEIDNLIAEIISMIGLTSIQINSSFHKSWGKIATATDTQLVIEQLFHYITTYGFEQLGIFDNDSVYIPNEVLEELPYDLSKAKVTVIKAYNASQITEKILTFTESGIALKEETVKDCFDLFVHYVQNPSVKLVNDVKNKELKAMLYDYFNLVPSVPVDFLRFVIYKVTNETLLIKNYNLIEKIKMNVSNHNLGAVKYFRSYEQNYGLGVLSEIFLRFKPLFLAFKKNTSLISTINKLSKLAITNHKPMKVDFLNEVTSMIKNGKRVYVKDLRFHLENVNFFRKVRLLYALTYRKQDPTEMVYRIRNGKTYYEAVHNKFNEVELDKCIKHVKASIIFDLNKKVEGKKIFLPEFVNYALPATEKQFIGNIPSGTYIEVDSNLIFGVHWFDGDRRVDLDLSYMSLGSGKVGWDGSYRTSSRNIMFSGDNTSAPLPNGASELFRITSSEPELGILNLNSYTFNNSPFVNYTLFAGESVAPISSNYMMNPNDIHCKAQSNIGIKQKVLGLVIADGRKIRFYFSEMEQAGGISAKDNDASRIFRKYLINQAKGLITLNELLLDSKAEIVDSVEEADIDLSQENLQKDTIIGLLQ